MALWGKVGPKGDIVFVVSIVCVVVLGDLRDLKGSPHQLPRRVQGCWWGLIDYKQVRFHPSPGASSLAGDPQEELQPPAFLNAQTLNPPVGVTPCAHMC